MKMIEPINVTGDMITSTDLAELVGEYTDAVTYAIGDQTAVFGITQTVFQAVQEVSGVDPVDDPDEIYWVAVGPTNRYAPFDDKINTVATRDDSLQVTVAIGRAFDGVALFGLKGVSATIEILDGGNVVHSRDFALVDNSQVLDWNAFFFGPIEESLNKVSATGLPGSASYELRVTVSSPGGVAELGYLVVGQTFTLGETTEGVEVTFVDYSSKDRDQFGNPLIVERPYVDRVTFPFVLDSLRVESVKSRLARNRAKACVFMVDQSTERFGTTVLGILDRFDAPVTVRKTYAQLEVTGYA